MAFANEGRGHWLVGPTNEWVGEFLFLISIEKLDKQIIRQATFRTRVPVCSDWVSELGTETSGAPSEDTSWVFAKAKDLDDDVLFKSARARCAAVRSLRAIRLARISSEEEGGGGASEVEAAVEAVLERTLLAALRTARAAAVDVEIAELICSSGASEVEAVLKRVLLVFVLSARREADVENVLRVGSRDDTFSEVVSGRTLLVVVWLAVGFRVDMKPERPVEETVSGRRRVAARSSLDDRRGCLEDKPEVEEVVEAADFRVDDVTPERPCCGL